MIDSRQPLGESFSPGAPPLWKFRKSRGAKAGGATYLYVIASARLSIELGRRLALGARNTHINARVAGRNGLAVTGGIIAIPAALRDHRSHRQETPT